MAAAVVCLLAAGAMSSPGRTALRSVLTALHITSATPEGDVEQRARARHGWSAAVANSVVRGKITYYDRNGMATRQVRLTLMRKYPDRLRVEIDDRGTVVTSGFDGTATWKSGSLNLGEEEARDIRAMLRIGPERLFVTRGGGGRYREVGRRIDEDRGASPDPKDFPPTGAKPRGKQKVLDQIETEDTIGLPPLLGQRVGDRRLVYYYVNREDSTIETARWLEPDDPRQMADDANTPLLDMRVDYSDWRRVDGVLWPFEVTCSKGGSLHYRIVAEEVSANQHMADTIFHNPNR
jgi:hypothetical protein